MAKMLAEADRNGQLVNIIYRFNTNTNNTTNDNFSNFGQNIRIPNQGRTPVIQGPQRPTANRPNRAQVKLNPNAIFSTPLAAVKRELEAEIKEKEVLRGQITSLERKIAELCKISQPGVTGQEVRLVNPAHRDF